MHVQTQCAAARRQRSWIWFARLSDSGPHGSHIASDPEWLIRDLALLMFDFSVSFPRKFTLIPKQVSSLRSA
jgi:hypothetical protein